MRASHRWTFVAITVGLMACQGLARAAAEDDALSLPAGNEPTAAAPSPWRAFGELALGQTQQRYGLGNQSNHRLSLDLRGQHKLDKQWRTTLSARLDALHPDDAAISGTVFSLREASVGWQDAAGDFSVDAGRINVRYGPAYGYNPTDFLRRQTVRAFTSADPIAQRENRLGTAMIRAQKVWSGGTSLSLGLAPRLAHAPSTDGSSTDWGATNSSRQALLALSAQPSDKLSGQALVYAREGQSPQIGLNGSGVLSDSTVVFGEWSRGREVPLFNQALGGAAVASSGNRAVAGFTWSGGQNLAITLEAEYNGFGAPTAQWDQAAAAGPAVLGSYLAYAQRQQDNAARQSVMLYASQRGGIWKGVDLTGLIRVNTHDHSRLMWLEVRHHWQQFDLALQWQQATGSSLSEYGVMPARSYLQVAGTWFF